MLSGVFKSAPRPTDKAESLTADRNRSNNNESVFGNSKAKESLSVDRELLVGGADPSDRSVSSDNSGVLSGLFRRSPKPPPKSAHAQEKSAPVYSEPSARDGNPSNQTNSGVFGWIFRNPFGSSAQEREKSEPPGETHSGSAQECGSEAEDRPAPAQLPVDSDCKTKADETPPVPPVPPRPTEEELSNTISYRLSLLNAAERGCNQQECGGEGVQEEREDERIKSGVTEREENVSEAAPKKLKKPKQQSKTETAAEWKSEDQDVVACSDRTEDDSEECVETAGEAANQQERDGKQESAEKSSLPKKKNVKKKKNPFMPHVAPKGKALQKRSGTGAEPVENDVQKKSLMEQLNDLRLERAHKEEEDLEGLMEWWSTVTQWEQMPRNEDMTEKEEAKAFAVTAEKVQRGIRVFNQLFSERAEGLWQHVIDLRAIADGLDRFNWRTKVAQITGGSTSAVGGVATITGLALAPVTMGTSLIVTAVGLGVAAAGGLTSASAGISNAVNNSQDRKKVERIVEDYQSKMADINKCMKFIKQGIENLRQFNLLRVKKQAYNRDFPGLNGVYEDGAMASKAVLINANEIMRVVQIANVAGSTAARAVQIASMATGVLTGLFVGMDIYFVAKDSQELRKGAKSEFAAKIREVADQLHEGLVELNTIREELQCSGTNAGASASTSTSPPRSTEGNLEKTSQS
ncbi:uncharacterized protein LOC118826275 isoform X2 [Colossoma macropomum]|uniref:uncharacterized protein LOC118826275 isoform X2 n=1 Tax=Colossoma macropomum TaxID=42526 RepID=UPI001864B857|nr:uncharacterized protein LOC118826275 isoform X2 [Colossoma macropomum]